MPKCRDRKVVEILLRKYGQTHIGKMYKFISGHIATNEYLFRFKKSPTEKCICGYESETLYHVMNDCHRYTM